MTARNWTKPDTHEALVHLYLRLNGYFTTGLVVHSPKQGANRTEIDCLAVRHPNHAQPEREVGPARFLAVYGRRIDLVICEVKSDPGAVAFNEPLRLEPCVLESVLRWAGILEDSEVARVAHELRPILNQGLEAREAESGVVTPAARVRGLLCCPPARTDDLAGGWCLVGSEIMRYANECFNPREPRPSSSERYNFTQWGFWLAPLVKYFKSLEPDDMPSTLEGLYRHLDAA